MNTINKVPGVKVGSPLISGLLYAMFAMIFSTVLVSLLLVLTNMEESSLTLYIYFIHSLCLFTGGFVCGKRADQKGWYYGGVMGVIYSLMVIMIGFLAYNVAPDWQAGLLIVLSFVTGAFGGALGVNSRK